MDDPDTILTLGMALAFAAIHLFVGRLRFLGTEPRSAWLSFAGGVAVGYVFLHVLPELGAHGRVFAEATGLVEPLADGLVYTLSLIGLALFYGIEKAILTDRERPGSSGDRDQPTTGVFWMHIAATATLVVTITYLLNHREDTTYAGLTIYFIAMALHFVTADFGSRAHHPKIYDRAARFVLAAATLLGWVLGVTVELAEIVIGCLFAFIAGAIILTIMKEELPKERESRFVPFLAGAALYAALVLGETALVA